jgi:hypothetical protein
MFDPRGMLVLAPTIPADGGGQVARNAGMEDGQASDHRPPGQREFLADALERIEHEGQIELAEVDVDKVSVAELAGETGGDGAEARAGGPMLIADTVNSGGHSRDRHLGLRRRV